MANFIEGSLQGNGRKIGIVVSRFNSFLSEKLLEGALDILTRSGVKSDDIDVARKSDSLARARSIRFAELNAAMPKKEQPFYINGVTGAFQA